MIKIVIFDVMGVIFEAGDDTNDLLVPYILNLNNHISPNTIIDLYIDASLGKITAYDFWTVLGFEAEHVDSIQKKYLETCLTLDSQFKESVKKIKEMGYKTALLSNDVSEWSQYVRDFHDINKYIDYAFISSDLGLRKPDPEIYKVALKEMKAHPSECVFIDDHPARVDAAGKLGMSSVLFNREKHDYNGLQILSFADLVKILSLKVGETTSKNIPHSHKSTPPRQAPT